MLKGKCFKTILRWIMVRQTGRNHTFKVNFLCQKSTEFFQKKNATWKTIFSHGKLALHWPLRSWEVSLLFITDSNFCAIKASLYSHKVCSWLTISMMNALLQLLLSFLQFTSLRCTMCVCTVTNSQFDTIALALNRSIIFHRTFLWATVSCNTEMKLGFTKVNSSTLVSVITV